MGNINLLHCIWANLGKANRILNCLPFNRFISLLKELFVRIVLKELLD